MQKIIRNCIQCTHCGEIIESKHRHDFVTCRCGTCSVDGGLDYTRRTYKNSRDDFIELTEYEEVEDLDWSFIRRVNEEV